MKTEKAIEKEKQIRFDSDDERLFHAWCTEAVGIGLLESFTYHEERYLLFNESRYGKEKFKKKYYRPDFEFPRSKIFSFSNLLEPSVPHFNKRGTIFSIDIKPKYEKFHDRKELFEMKRRIVLNEYGVLVNPVCIDDFFKETFAPRAAYKKGKLPSRFNGCVSVWTFKGQLLEKYKKAQTEGFKGYTRFIDELEKMEQVKAWISFPPPNPDRGGSRFVQKKKDFFGFPEISKELVDYLQFRCADILEKSINKTEVLNER